MFIKWTPIIVLAKARWKSSTPESELKLDFIIRIITDKKLHFYHKCNHLNLYYKSTNIWLGTKPTYIEVIFPAIKAFNYTFNLFTA